MNLVSFAMRRPVALMMVLVTLIGGGALALNQMRVDIFPAINAPQIYVVNNYAGMDPSQIEGIITNVYEQNFQYVDGLKSVESKNIQNLVLLKLTFYPGTDMAAAMSQVVSLSNRARGQMPPSVLPPFVMRFDAANVPIGYLVLESKTRPLGELADLGLFRIRPLLIARYRGRSLSRRSAATRGRSSSRWTPTGCGRTIFRPRMSSRRWGRATWSCPRAICIPRADAAGADERDGGRSAGDGKHPRQTRRERVHSRCGRHSTTRPTSTTAARWSTGESPFIFPSSRRTRPPR